MLRRSPKTVRKRVSRCVSRSSTLPLDAGDALLTLCECEKALGPPNGLGCSKEGWFVSNFENQGTWVSARNLVRVAMGTHGDG